MEREEAMYLMPDGRETTGRPSGLKNLDAASLVWPQAWSQPLGMILNMSTTYGRMPLTGTDCTANAAHESAAKWQHLPDTMR